MKWFERPEWAAFTARIIKHPGDDTARLVAADWLEETGEESAVRRAEFIRRQFRGEIPPYLALRPGDSLIESERRYASAGLVEPAYHKTAGVVMDRGFPVWAVFLPHWFSRKNVAPVFLAAPLTTCSTVGMSAYHTHENTHSARGTVDLYQFYEGPENPAGEVDYAGQIERHFLENSFEHIARRGGNPHAEVYRRPGRVPFPIYNQLPVEGGAGGSRPVRRRDQYRAAITAAQAILKATMNCGRAWAKLPQRVGRRVVWPEDFAVWTVVINTLASDRISPDDEYPPAPTLATDPFKYLAEAKRTVSQMPGYKGRVYGETIIESVLRKTEAVTAPTPHTAPFTVVDEVK